LIDSLRIPSFPLRRFVYGLLAWSVDVTLPQSLRAKAMQASLQTHRFQSDHDFLTSSACLSNPHYLTSSLSPSFLACSLGLLMSPFHSHSGTRQAGEVSPKHIASSLIDFLSTSVCESVGRLIVTSYRRLIIVSFVWLSDCVVARIPAHLITDIHT
jgi:hypothetical protein